MGCRIYLGDYRIILLGRGFIVEKCNCVRVGNVEALDAKITWHIARPFSVETLCAMKLLAVVALTERTDVSRLGVFV